MFERVHVDGPFELGATPEHNVIECNRNRRSHNAQHSPWKLTQTAQSASDARKAIEVIISQHINLIWRNINTQRAITILDCKRHMLRIPNTIIVFPGIITMRSCEKQPRYISLVKCSQHIGKMHLYTVIIRAPLLSIRADPTRPQWDHADGDKYAGNYAQCAYTKDVTFACYTLHRRHIVPFHSLPSVNITGESCKSRDISFFIKAIIVAARHSIRQ